MVVTWETKAALSPVFWSLSGLEDARTIDDLLNDVVVGWAWILGLGTNVLFGWNLKIAVQFLEVRVAIAAVAAIDSIFKLTNARIILFLRKNKEKEIDNGLLSEPPAQIAGIYYFRGKIDILRKSWL